MDALIAEWHDRQKEITEPVETIYIGGGTPSTLSVEAIGRLCEEIMKKPNNHGLFKSPVLQEITIEANPGDITPEKAQAWRAIGINRLSIGIQTFNDQLLQLIGRRHTSEEARQAVIVAQAAGFDNISIDLIYALPGQTLEQWQSDVVQALELGVQHISTYGLIYEDGTVLTTLLENGVIEAVEEDVEMQMYDYIVETLTENGYVHYEVSNFALKGRESIHNSNYWNDIPYIGLGAGAHSYNCKQRQWNISELDTYIKQALAHNLQPEIETLTDEQHHTEQVMLKLRTNRGVSQTLVNKTVAEKYIDQGLLVKKGGNIVATTKGFHILNIIIENLL